MPAFSAEYGRWIRTAVSRGLVAAPLLFARPSCGPEPTNKPTGTSSNVSTEQVEIAPPQVSRVEWQGIVEKPFEVKGRIELPEGQHFTLEELKNLKVAFSGKYLGEGTKSWIVTVDFQGYFIHSLTPAGYVSESPVWLDEETLIISMNKEGEEWNTHFTGDRELYQLNLAKLKQLTFDEVTTSSQPLDDKPVISPDRKYVAFQREEGLGAWQDPGVAILDLETGQITQLGLPKFETFAEKARRKLATIEGMVFTSDSQELLIIRDLSYHEDEITERADGSYTQRTLVDSSTYIVQVVDIKQNFKLTRAITLGTFSESVLIPLGISLDGKFLGFHLLGQGTFGLNLETEEVFAVDKGFFVGTPHVTSNGQYFLHADINRAFPPHIRIHDMQGDIVGEISTGDWAPSTFWAAPQPISAIGR